MFYVSDNFQIETECKKDSDCNGKHVNNCQDGYCYCADEFGGCIDTSDTCHEISRNKYEAICGCGKTKTPCEEYELCHEGKCITNPDYPDYWNANWKSLLNANCI